MDLLISDMNSLPLLGVKQDSNKSIYIYIGVCMRGLQRMDSIRSEIKSLLCVNVCPFVIFQRRLIQA